MLAMYLQLSTNEQTRGIKDTVKIRLPGSLHLTLDQGLETVNNTTICCSTTTFQRLPYHRYICSVSV
jgi:hypothetical protein